MRTRFLINFIGCLLLSSGLVIARDPRSGSSDPFGQILPVEFSNNEGGGLLSPETVLLAETDNPAPKPLSAALPPDPESPAWGQFDSPIPPPITSRPTEYNLIGPPRGVIQNIDGQDYQAVISDPRALFDIDATFGQAVDIFRPDGMAPVGMFGDHTLPPGKAFISYRYLQNSFDQNYQGSHATGVPTSFALAPTRMLQDSQVALVEYGVTQDFTMMAYLPFQHNSIDLLTATGGANQSFTNPGDIRIQGLLVVTRGERSQSHLNLGLSLPVGFLEQITTFGGTPQAVPYPLITSSGTYDLLLGYTYRKQTDFWTFGAQANGVVPTGKNTLGYEIGNQFQLTGWASRRWTDRWSTSARLDGHVQGNIRGSDARLDPTLSPIYSPNAQGRQYINGLLGVNYLFTRPGHRISEQRLFLEAGAPLYQWVDGPQLGLSWTLNAGWGMAF